MGRRALPDGRVAPRAGDRGPLDGRLRRAHLRGPPPGRLRGRGVILALEIGSEAALGPRAENAARWRAHLPISLAARLQSLALVELRTGDGRPGPLDRPGTPRDCGACDLERFLHPANVRLHERLARLGIRYVWDDYGPGTHDWPYWRRDLRRTLPGLMRALGS